MVTIFRLVTVPNETQWALPTDRSFTAAGGMLFDGTPKAATWKPPTFYIQNPLKPRANFFMLNPGALAFDAAVRDHPYVGMFLEMAGEILPIALDTGESIFVLNVTECVNALDSQRTEFRLDPTTKVRAAIVRYAFDVDRMTQSPIFKIPETRRAEILTFSGRFACAEDEFMSVFTQTKFTGLKFEPVWKCPSTDP